MTIELDEEDAVLLIGALTEYTRSALPTVARIVPGMRHGVEVAVAKAVLLRQKIAAHLTPPQPQLPAAPPLPPESAS